MTMQPSLLILHFPVSKSKFYRSAIKLSEKFDRVESGKINRVSMTMADIFEKWEYFNLLFWKVCDWSGSILEFEGVRYQDHRDKTRIFYALQLAHTKHLCYVIDRIKEMHRVQVGEIKLEEIDSIVYSEDDMNILLDYYQIVKTQVDVKQNQF